MQLIRAINKSNKSNNNNQTSSASNNKVVIVAPPARSSTSVSQQQQQKPPKKGGSEQPQAPVSPSIAIPALKKRTSIVKQSVPPPVPPRGSPRSKSKLIGVSRSRRNAPQPVKSTIDVDRLKSLSSLEQSGCQKVKRWLETVVVPSDVEISIPENIEFKSVKSLIETFSHTDDGKSKRSFGKKSQVHDSCLVKARVASYDSLKRDLQQHAGASHNPKLRSSDGGTDSGIDIPARKRDGNARFMMTNPLFTRDGEFV
jgi:hypothetical protein